MIVARAPGRVNLIGDHTDYTGGLVLPMAIDRWTEVRGERRGDRVVLHSADAEEPALVPLDVDDPSAVEPQWARYVAGVVSEMRPALGFEGEVSTTIPIGSGLSSSAALEVAVARALGIGGSALDIARICQSAEQRASGVPCGIMDQLASAGGVEGAALLIDCRSLTMTPVALPEDVDIVVVDSGEPRALATSAYEERVRACARAEEQIGPLRDAKIEAVYEIADPHVRACARHVISENERTLWFSKAIAARAFHDAGLMMDDSHASLRDDYEVSTPGLDRCVDELRARPGVFGARLTGAGFGGCVVALAERGAVRDTGWVVRPVGGATVSEV
jgi:galactokinase